MSDNLTARVVPKASSSTTSVLRRNGTNDDRQIAYGESMISRTVYLAVALVAMSLLTGMLGYRVRQLENQHNKTICFTSVLVVILNCFAMSFVTSAAFVEIGLGLATPHVCHASVILCLVFYVGSKVVMYFFLVERAHALRAPYIKRTRDRIWLVGMFTIVCGFGIISVCGFLWAISHLSTVDGRCRIGLPYRVTIPMLAFDIIMNLWLTGVFVHLLRPLLRFGGLSHGEGLIQRISHYNHGHSRSVDLGPIHPSSLKSIERLVWKTLAGSLLAMLPTAGNLGALFQLRGQEQAWVCLTVCTLDVTWSVCVVHWLTVGSADVDERESAMHAQRAEATSHAEEIVRPSATLQTSKVQQRQIEDSESIPG